MKVLEEWEIDEGTPEDEWHATSSPRHPKKTLRLWYRGNCYVRICEVLPVEWASDKSAKYSINCGYLDDPDKTDGLKYQYQTSDNLEQEALKLMRVGGH